MLELGFVLFMISFFSAIGWGTIRDDLPRFRMIGVSKDFASDLDMLRISAISNNHEMRLLLVDADPEGENPESSGGIWKLQAGNSSNQSSSWEDFPIDANEDGSDDQTGLGTVDIGETGNRRSRGVGLADWGSLSGPGSGNTDAIVFTPRGWVSNPASDFDSQGYITLRFINKTALGHGITDEVHVRIARSGYVRLESTLGPVTGNEPVGTSGSSSDGM